MLQPFIYSVSGESTCPVFLLFRPDYPRVPGRFGVYDPLHHYLDAHLPAPHCSRMGQDTGRLGQGEIEKISYKYTRRSVSD